MTRPARTRAGRRAVTLVEVLASVVILGGAATSMLLAHASSLEQLRLAELQANARDLGKELIASWRVEGTDLSRQDAGRFAEAPGWHWRRQCQEIELAAGVRILRVELEIQFRGPPLTWSTRVEWLVERAPPRK